MGEGVRLVVGLGNPGDEYAGTRHNAGFAVVDRLAEKWGARYWKSEHGAQVAHVKAPAAAQGPAADDAAEELLLAKPQAFMNCSGGPVSKIASAYGISPAEILVVHDDMDLEPGTIRVKVGGGHAGHNGLRSIHAKLGSSDYLRVRVGIGHPPGRMTGADFVLQAPRRADAEAFGEALEKAAEAVELVVSVGAETAMNRCN